MDLVVIMMYAKFYIATFCLVAHAFSALTLLVWHQEEHPVCKKIER